LQTTRLTLARSPIYNVGFLLENLPQTVLATQQLTGRVLAVETNAALLEPVRASFRDNVPLRWNRVYDLPDFVYFNHSIHVAKGVGCVTCHGRMELQALVGQFVLTNGSTRFVHPIFLS